MKNFNVYFLLPAVFALSLFSSCGTHLDEAALLKKYKVRSQTMLEKSGEKSEYVEYDENGREVLKENYTDGVCTDREQTSYDSAGNILQMNQMGAGSTELKNSRYEYINGTNGKPLTMKKYNADKDSLLSVASFTYDEKGNRILMSIKNTEGKETWRYCSEYDGSGNEISLKVYDAFEGWEKPWRSKIMEYDSKGHLIKVTHFLEPGKISGHFEKKYDERGLLQSFVYYDADNKATGETSVVYTYYK